MTLPVGQLKKGSLKNKLLKKGRDMIKIKNSFFEKITNKNIKPILEKEFTAKTSYWLARIFDKIESEARHYFAEKQKLIKKHALIYDEDTDNHKKGDIVQNGNNISIKDPEAFTKELEEILEIEVDFGWKKIGFDFDREPNLSVEDMMVILPFIAEK